MIFDDELYETDECYNCYGDCDDCPYTCGDIYESQSSDLTEN